MKDLLGLLKYKRLLAAVALFALGLLLVLAFSGNTAKSEVTHEETLAEYKERLEGELEKLCSSVSGVGKCTVTVSFSKGTENSYRGSNLVETKPPVILGVTVVCKGADSAAVRSALTDLFTALFAIPTNRVAILKLN